MSNRRIKHRLKKRFLAHLNRHGQARMVDVSEKPATVRWARAQAVVRLNSTVLRRLREKTVAKGDAWALARAAGIMASKRTSEFVPLAHPLPLAQTKIEFSPERTGVRIESFVKTTAPTGVELEAFMAAWGAALTLYDMIKSVQRDAEITDIFLLEKAGGRSGHFIRSTDRS